MFALQLVDATAGIPLNEHIDGSGQAWVAGEEGDEYFLQVRHVADPGCDTKCIIEVDGEEIDSRRKGLGSRLTWSHNLGLRKAGQTVAPGEEGIIHALKFARIGQAAAAGDGGGAEDEDGRPPAHGLIVARFHRYTVIGKRTKESTASSRWQGSSSQQGDNKKEGAAALKSTTGSAPSSYKVSRHRTQTNEEVGRVSIRYTSEFGLAVRGMLTAGNDDQQQADAPARTKRRKREAGDHSAASSSAAAHVTIGDDDDEKEQKPAVSGRATGFTNGETIDLLSDSD